MTKMATDPQLQKFRGEYEKLNKALKMSHESERRLLGKCRELSQDLTGNATKV